MSVSNFFFLCVLLPRLLCGMDLELEVRELVHAFRNPLVTRVNMDEVKTVSVQPDESTHTLWTCALAGCTAVAIVATTPTGERVALMAHLISNLYPAELEQVLRQLVTKNYTHTSALIITPGNPVCQTPTFPRFSETLEMLIASTFSHLSLNTICYDALKDECLKSIYHALILQVPGSESAQPPHYRSWLSEGNL